MSIPHSEPAEHDPHLKHHFATADQQLDSATLGMWTFLITEVLFFGGMFTAYVIYRNLYPGAFASTSEFMNVPLGAVNTGVLICSSLSMALAVRAAQMSQRKALIISLIFTMVFGVAFLCVKAYEYHDKYVEHLIPGPNFLYPQAPEYFHNAQILFFLYFAMTGMHALHMIIGFRPVDLFAGAVLPIQVQFKLFHASRDDRPLLALRRRSLDLPVPLALSDRTSHMSNFSHESTHPHIPKVGTLVAVWATLIVLTFATTASSYLELGEFNIVLAMVIALTKVGLVAWIFMGVRYSSTLTRLFCVAGLVWLVIMMIVTSSDYFSRGWQYQAQPWSHAASGGDSR